MNNLKIAWRTFFKKGQNNVIKVISLGTGLAVGLLLLAKVSFDQNFDNFYPDAERIYKIETKISEQNNDTKEFGTVSGAIAPGLKMEIPGVEVATRFTGISSKDAVFYDMEKHKYTGTFILGDSCLFDVLPRPMVAGNAKEVLSQPMYALVAKSIADKMGVDVVGKQIVIDTYPDRVLTIGGVFEDIPENSHNYYSVVVSMASISKFTWDGSMNWLGNDRYNAYVKLRKGTDPSSLAQLVRAMQEKYQNISEIEAKNGTKLEYTFNPLTRLHSDSSDVKRMVNLLSILAFALLFTAVMNYMLIVISSLVVKARSIAVNKCYGAAELDITRQMMVETTFHIILSLILGILLIFCFKNTIEHILATSVGALITPQSIILMLGICILVFIIAALIPAYMLSRIPVATVFRTFNKSRKGWKMALLFMQFVAAAFLFTLIVTVSKQYRVMTTDNPGYNYENIIYADTWGADIEKRRVAFESIKQLPEVKNIALASDLPIYEMSGNNVSLPDTEKELFNIADMYFVDENYFPLMQIPVIEGVGFTEENTASDILVSTLFAEKMKMLAGWDDGVIGKEVYISEHGLSHIIGVFPNIRIGSATIDDKRPAVIFYAQKGSKFAYGTASTILVRLNQMNGDNINKVSEVLKTIMPDKDITIVPYSDSVIKLYDKEDLFRQSVLIGCIVVIIITFIGLIGYVNNEIVRRTSEIAIRQISGATLSEILKLFIKDILLIAPIALLIGCIAAAVVTNIWIQDFSVKATFSPFLYIGCGLAVLLLIELVVVINCLKIANQNPIESLKTE